jgi:DNA-binding NarL/FixJ family response regulator
MDIIKLILADDHTIVRQGLRKLLEDEPDLEILSEATTGRDAVRMALDLHPHVVVMDIAMPDLNGLEAARQIIKTEPKIKILILSAHWDDAYVERAIAVGASGFLIKQSSAIALANGIREIRKGKRVFSQVIAKRLRDKENPASDLLLRVTHPELTTREMEVLQLIAEGSANKQTAAALSISIKTVEKHRANLMRKLDIHDTAGLTRYAIQTGIVESSGQVTIL